MAKKQTWTIKQLIAGFKVSDMTIFTWRQGTASRDPLPTELEGRRVLAPRSAIAAWAKKHKLPFDVMAAEAVEAAVPGPVATRKRT